LKRHVAIKTFADWTEARPGFVEVDLVAHCGPYRKNDGCYVEQKNWAVVRRLVGYQRLEAPALAALERVHEVARDDVNFLHPVRRLTEKVRLGARVTRRFDTAQTPYRRLLASDVLAETTAADLADRSAALDRFSSSSNSNSSRRSARSPHARFNPPSSVPSGRMIMRHPPQTLVGSSIEARRPARCLRMFPTQGKHEHWRA
jgi:hypothetical protein